MMLRTYFRLSFGGIPNSFTLPTLLVELSISGDYQKDIHNNRIKTKPKIQTRT